MTATTQLIRDAFAAKAALKAAFPGRHFTLDGQTIGSIGEVLAAERYGQILTTASTKGIDAHDTDDKPVEIKATSSNGGIALRGLRPLAECLIVLKTSSDGSDELIYDGPAGPVWDAISGKRMGTNGQRTISQTKLRELQQGAD